MFSPKVVMFGPREDGSGGGGGDDDDDQVLK